MANDLNIRIKINSDTKALEVTQDGFEKIRQKAQSASEPISNVSNGFEKISGSAKKTSSDIQNFDSKLNKTINTVKDFAIAYISLNTAMEAGKYFVENADSLNRLDGRLKLATDSTAEFHSQQKELLAIAKETHSPLKNITDLYIKMDPALEKLGATTKTTNQITENFAKGLKLGGANTVESSAAILQFAQAMGSGVLRGDEFNSMAEASPKLMEYLAKGLKVPQGELRNMAEAGELTAGRVSAALLTMTTEIERDFKQMPRVVGDAAVDFGTEASLMVQDIDKATGATAALADGIDSAAALISNKNGVLDEFTDTVMTAGIAVASIGIGLGVSRLAMAGYAATTGIATAGQLGFTTAIIAGTVATKAKAAAAVGLRIAMNEIPMVAIATGVALIASHFITAARNANLLTDALVKTNEELQNMSKNQLLAQRSTIERGVQEKLTELQDAGLEVRRAKQSGADKEDLIALKAHYDDLAAEYKRLTDQRSSIDAAMNKPKASAKPKEDENAALKKQIEELLKNGAKIDKPKAGKSAAKKAAEEQIKLNKQLEEDLFKSTHTQYENEVRNIENTVSKYIDGGADRVKAKELETSLLIKLGESELKSFNEKENEKAKKLLDAQQLSEDMYTKLNDLSGNWYDNELLNTSKWVNDYIEKGGEIEKANEYLNNSILKLNQKRFDEQRDLNQKRLEEENAFWLDLMGNIDKAVESQFFDAMTGKFESFGSWLKDFWSSVTDSMVRGFSKTMADMMTGSLFSVENGSVSGIIPSMLKAMAPATAAAMLVGSSVSAADLASIQSSAFVDSEGITQTAGGTVIDAGGQIIGAGSDIGTLVNTVSSLKTAYEVATAGIAGYVTSGMESAASAFWAAGDTAVGNALGLSAAGDFFGGASFFTSGTALPAGYGTAGAIGYMAIPVLGGALAGYGVGSLGDKILGANTYAGTTGAIGGAAGGFAGALGMFGMAGGPVGALAGIAIGSLLGSAIGGIFGKKKETDSGIMFQSDTTANSSFDDVIGYSDWKKKGWFSSSSGTTPIELSATKIKAIEGIFDTYDYLLAQLGNIDHITLAAGKYSQETFGDQLSKNFIETFTGIPQKLEETLTEYSVEIAMKGGWVSSKILDESTAAIFDATTETIRTRTIDNAQFTELYGQWVDYAKSIDKTVMQAMTDSVNTFIQSQRDFDVWSLERNGDSTESLRMQAKWLQDDFTNLSNMIGATGVTVDNFSQLYEDAVKNSFDPTTVSQWQSLGSALVSATDAQDAYAKALADSSAQQAAILAQQQQNAIDAFNTIGTAYNQFSERITTIRGYIDELNGVAMTFADAGDNPEKVMQAYNAQVDAINAAHVTRIDALNTEMQSIKKIVDYSKSLVNAANSLRYNALADSSKFEYSNTELTRLIADATAGLSSGADIGDKVSRISELSGNYAQLAQGYYSTQAEFDFAVGSMANKIEALGGSGGSSADLGDIEAAIIAENNSLQSAIDSMKEETVSRLLTIEQSAIDGQQVLADQLKGMTDGYVSFWGEGSPIISTLRNILSAMLATEGSSAVYDKSGIDAAYSSVLGRTPDAGGAAYWSSQIASGSVASSQIGIAVGAAAATNGEIGIADYVAKLYESGLGRAPDAGGLAFWTDSVANGSLSLADLSSTFASAAEQNGEKFHAFAEGGIVKGGKGGIIGQIGEKDYDEVIFPLKDSNDPLGGKAILAELRALRFENARLRNDLNKVLAQIDNNTKQSRSIK